MVGTKLIEELVQSVALTRHIRHYDRVSLLLLASPENGKTTITSTAKCKSVQSVSVMTARSIMAEMNKNKDLEYIIFNDMTCVKALSVAAVNLLIVILNQITQGEHGLIGFAGKPTEVIDREIGIIGCLPIDVFTEYRSNWKRLGFVSRMLPFAYCYSNSLIAEIKDGIDVTGTSPSSGVGASKKMLKAIDKIAKKPQNVQIQIEMSEANTTLVRTLADEKAIQLKQLGIRLLKNYHSLIRAHALLQGRRVVNQEDMKFLWDVNRFISTDSCTQLESKSITEFKDSLKESKTNADSL